MRTAAWSRAPAPTSKAPESFGNTSGEKVHDRKKNARPDLRGKVEPMKPAALAAALSSFVLFAHAQVNDRAAAGWTFAVTPYVWLPSVDGTVNVDPPAGGGGAASVGEVKREAALMLAGEARKGPWA